MPGYEVDRFVGYPENEATCQLLKDLSCSICLEVLCRPVLTGGCCYEAYCESCLKVWLEANHTCPSDNKLLKEEALAPPPTLLVKQIGKLKLKCVFEERGCKVVSEEDDWSFFVFCFQAVIPFQVTTVAKIEAHEKSCPLNGEPCGTCGLYPGANGNGNGSSSHSCLKALLEHRKTVSAAMDRLCLEMDEAEMEHRNVRSQIDNCKKILKALTVERVSQSHSRPSSSSSSSSSSSGRIRDQRDLLTEARRYISSPIVEARQTRKELVERVLEVVKEAVTGGGQHFEEFKHAHGGRSHYRHNPVEFVVRYVKEALDGSCLGDWNAYARYNGLGAVCHHLLEDGYVEVKLGKVTITVFRTVESVGFG